MDFGSIGVQAANTTSHLKRPRYDNASSETAFFSIDDALDYAGDNSRFQKRVNNIFSFQYMIYSFLMMGFPLLIVKPTFYCPDADGTGVHVCLEKDFCEYDRSTPCTGPACPSVHDNGETTIVTDFALYCDKSYLTGILGSVLFFGSFLAFFFFPYIANSKGRKFSILVANIISGVSALAVAFSPNIEFMMVFLVLGGFAFSGFEILIFVYTAEVSGERFRNYSTVTLGAVWAIAQLMIPLLFWFTGRWDYIFLWCMAVPWLISLWPNVSMVFETPRFLNQKKRFAKAREVINKICAINLRQPFRAKLYGEMDEENSKMTTFFPPKQPRVSEQPRQTMNSSKPAQTSAIGYMDLFKYPRIRRISLALLYVWFFRNFTYFGLNYSLPVLGTEVYQNFTLTAFSETLANIYAYKFKFGIGRIQSLNYSILIVTFSCLISYFLPIPEECLLEQSQCYQKTFLVIIAVIAKFGIGLFANILITYTSECYPTDIRALGLGLTLTISRIGTVAMPYIIAVMQDNYVSPLVLMGAMGLVAFVTIKFFLTETLNETMMDTLVEMQALNTPLLRNQDHE